MSSLVNRRVFRSEASEEDVFVIGEPLQRTISAEGPLTTVSNLLDGAKRRGEQAIADAAGEASGIVESARAEADAIREEARRSGYEAGVASGHLKVDQEVAAYLETIREAAAEGVAIRDGLIDEAMPAIARAIAMATRRVVGAAYEADPSLIVDACSDAVRAAAGQQILSIRVNPEALETVRAGLLDVAEYVRPDTAIELGGCVIDLRGGSIDATLDARLSLMDLALQSAGGGE
ncbi:MAG: FliH/SctL family protein [bacterium]